MVSLQDILRKVVVTTKAATFALITAAMFSSCATKITCGSKGGINPGFGMGFGTDYTKYEVKGDQIQTIPFHPSDGGVERGQTTVKIDGESDYSITANVEGSLGTERFRLKAGLEGRLHSSLVGYSISAEQREALPPPHESYASTYLDLEPFSYSPYLGLDIIIDPIFLSAEFSLPYLSGDITTKQERYSHLNEISNYPFDSFGNGFEIFLGIKNPKSSDGVCEYERIGIFYRGENFDIGNGNKINTTSYGLMIIFGPIFE